jgi:hypothetical protein
MIIGVPFSLFPGIGIPAFLQAIKNATRGWVQAYRVY